MSDIPNPGDLIAKMIEASARTERAKDLAPVGSYGKEYVDRIKDRLNGDNAEAYYLGTATISTLVQEILIVMGHAAGDLITDAKTPEDRAYARGLRDSTLATVRYLAATADGLVGLALKDPLIDREFGNIVANMK